MSIALLLAIPAVAATPASPGLPLADRHDDTGQAKSVVEIYRAADGTFAGKVVGDPGYPRWRESRLRQVPGAANRSKAW